DIQFEEKNIEEDETREATEVKEEVKQKEIVDENVEEEGIEEEKIDEDKIEGQVVEEEQIKVELTDEEPIDEIVKEEGEEPVKDEYVDKSRSVDEAVDNVQTEEEQPVKEPEIEEVQKEEVQIEEAQIEEAQIEEAQIEEVQIEEVQIEEVQIEEAQIEDAQTEEAQIEDAQIEEVQLEETEADELFVEEFVDEELVIEEQEEQEEIERIEVKIIDDEEFEDGPEDEENDESVELSVETVYDEIKMDDSFSVVGDNELVIEDFDTLEEENSFEHEDTSTLELNDLDEDQIEKEGSALENKEIIEPVKRDYIPQEMVGTKIKDENVYLIDDETVQKDDEEVKPIVEEEKLRAITSGIVDLVKGEAKQLEEADQEDEVFVTVDIPLAFDDLLIDTEEKQIFVDEDIDFVDDVFLSEESEGKATAKDPVSHMLDGKRVTLHERSLGIDEDEFGIIENKAFGDDYKNVDLNEGADIIKSVSASDQKSSKNYKYILPRSDSLTDEERISIEEDLISESALIFEEDVDQIKERLEQIMKKKIQETIQDITDRITIIEDGTESNEAVIQEVKEKKKELGRLFKYLDELFGKLPEKTIEEFAGSEYYELYEKVLKDLNK
ncbi:MAG: hypothetical protein GY863_00840, partial [bacterium]|nr:hypothetical protein [bacterium]